MISYAWNVQPHETKAKDMKRLKKQVTYNGKKKIISCVTNLLKPYVQNIINLGTSYGLQGLSHTRGLQLLCGYIFKLLSSLYPIIWI